MGEMSRELAVAILEVNIGKPGPWNFDAMGAAVVSGAWRVVAASLPPAETDLSGPQRSEAAVSARDEPLPSDHDGERSAGWRDIATYEGCHAVLVSRPTGREVYAPTTAFMDVTGVWRVYRSEGGNTPLPFAPTHWMPLPQAPDPSGPQGGEGEGLRASQSQPCGAGPSDLAGPQSQHTDGED